jgi:hypothetical protein
MLHKDLDYEDFIINYDPRKPHPRFFDTEMAAFEARAEYAEPVPMPWPTGMAPRPKAITPKPSDSAPLPKADFVVVTWTVAEAVMLAQLFTPDIPIEQWYLYAHNWDAFEPLITGFRAPSKVHDSRYYHKLGAYYMTKIGDAKVLCFKSNLHISTDGEKLPLLKLWTQIISEAKPKMIITGGAVGANVKLGDVVIAESTLFDLVGHFKTKDYAHASFPCTTVDKKAFKKVSKEMLLANAPRLKPLRKGKPKLFFPGGTIAHPKIITTDIFAFDDTVDSFKLQGKGNMVEMDDATLGLVITQQNADTKWVAIRNASDPQVDGTIPPKDRKKEAAQIYLKYGYWTTIGSVLASWAVIVGP